MSGLKRALVVGVVCGCAATAWVAGHVRVEEEAPATAATAAIARNGRTVAPRKGVSRFLPWSFALDVREDARTAPAERPDPYRGPRMTVTITVVDDEGQPMPGALVEARAYMEEYEVAGLTDDEYAVWAEASDAAERAEEEAEEAARAGAVDGEYEDPEIEETYTRVAVQSGRTDRKGSWQAELKPDAEVVFHARVGKREGVSAPFTTWTRDDLENPVDDADDQENGEENEHDRAYRGPNAITIEIAALTVLAGTVHDELGNPVANAKIDIAALDSDDETGYREVEDLVVDPGSRDDEGGEFLLVTAEDGSFRIPLRTYGAFDVTFEADGLRPTTEYAVQLVPGNETILSVTMPVAAQLAGTVLDDRGEPLAQVSVQFSVHVPGGSRGWGTFTNADGTFTLGGLEPGEGELRVNAEGFIPREIERISASEPSLVVRLDRDHSVLVAVREDIQQEVIEPQDLSQIFGGHLEKIDDPVEDLADALFTPDVRIEPTNAGVIVLAARPAPNGRLYGGDRVVSIDGRAVGEMDEWEAVGLLDGPKGSRCRIVVERPATQQTVAVDLERVVPTVY